MHRAPATMSRDALVTGKPVVLVVEENAVFRAATANRLRTAGFEVLEAANSAEAHQILKSTVVDALVSDIPSRQNKR